MPTIIQRLYGIDRKAKEVVEYALFKDAKLWRVTGGGIDAHIQLDPKTSPVGYLKSVVGLIEIRTAAPEDLAQIAEIVTDLNAKAQRLRSK